MTRNAEGDIVQQCEAKYTAEVHHVRCVLEQGHEGPHRDARGEWGKEPTSGR